MVKLVIFDVDGVLIDSENLYLKAAAINCEKYHYDIPLDILKKVIGGNTSLHKQIVLDYKGQDFNFDEYHNNLINIIYDLRQKSPAPKKKGVDEILSYLKKMDIKIAIATSTERQRQMFNLKACGLENSFDYMVFGDDIKNSKPDPEIYIKAWSHFNFKKEETIIVEDSINGILSGINAGIRVIYIPDIINVPKDIEDKTIKLNDLNELMEKINKEEIWKSH